MNTYKNQCPITINAPFKGEMSEHQCSYDKRQPHEVHYCGCGHEWTTDRRLVRNGEAR